MDLHGYGHWSCQLALLAGLRTMYHRFMKPNGRFPNSDLVVSSCSSPSEQLIADFPMPIDHGQPMQPKLHPHTNGCVGGPTHPR